VLREETTPSNSCWSSTPCTAVYAHGGAFSLTLVEQRPGITTFSVDGVGAKELFANESGGHRWQRKPPNEKRDRVHTSTVTVAVMAEPSEIEMRLEDKDLRWSTCRGSGAGGQHRNKTESAVIVTHIPTGTSVRCESERSQHQNRRTALTLLRAKLWQDAKNAQVSVTADYRKRQVGSGQRGDKRRTIRTQDDSVVDHVTGRRWRYKDYVRGEW